MARSGPEVADTFRRYGAAYRESHGASLCIAQRRVMSAIESVELPHLVVMSSAAITVTTSASATIVVLWAKPIMGSWRQFDRAPAQSPPTPLPITRYA